MDFFSPSELPWTPPAYRAPGHEPADAHALGAFQSALRRALVRPCAGALRLPELCAALSLAQLTPSGTPSHLAAVDDTSFERAWNRLCHAAAESPSVRRLLLHEDDGALALDWLASPHRAAPARFSAAIDALTLRPTFRGQGEHADLAASVMPPSTRRAALRATGLGSGHAALAFLHNGWDDDHALRVARGLEAVADALEAPQGPSAMHARSLCVLHDAIARSAPTLPITTPMAGSAIWSTPCDNDLDAEDAGDGLWELAADLATFPRYMAAAGLDAGTAPRWRLRIGGADVLEFCLAERGTGVAYRTRRGMRHLGAFDSVTIERDGGMAPAAALAFIDALLAEHERGVESLLATHHADLEARLTLHVVRTCQRLGRALLFPGDDPQLCAQMVLLRLLGELPQRVTGWRGRLQVFDDPRILLRSCEGAWQTLRPIAGLAAPSS